MRTTPDDSTGPRPGDPRAGEEIYTLTSQLNRRPERMAGENELDGFPHVLAFQSAVDATIPPAGVVDRLLGKLKPGSSNPPSRVAHRRA